MKKWIINKPDKTIVDKLMKQIDLTNICAEILVGRGIDSIEKIKNFICKQELEDPFVLKDMDKAVKIINTAVDEGKKICIYGDYDCDGITSTVMLYSFLECIGAEVMYYVPERDEGYGINLKSIEQLSYEGVELIITVDNGISAIAESKYIKNLGIQLIITDHHQPGNFLPEADAIINPHRKDCPSSFKLLCGAGVVLKLIAALDGGDYDAVLEQFSDLVALATVADVVKLENENRLIVEQGLITLKNTERVGLLALMRLSGLLDKELKSTDAAFMLAPRINAAGRFGSPKQAIELLLCDDPEQAELLAEHLNTLNNQRKKAELEIIHKIEENLQNNPDILNQRVLIFNGENWHHGVIGIVASRLVERFGKPCFIITIEGEQARGSIRAFGDFSVFNCLTYCDKLLLNYGGHSGAGGFSIETSNINKFKSMIYEYALINHPVMPNYTIIIDKFILPEEITEKNIESLKIFEPSGEGNKKPLFIICGAVVDSIIPLSNGQHTKLNLIYGNRLLTALMFRVKTEELSINKGEKWDFVVNLEVNSYNNKKSCVLYVKDYRKSGIKQLAYFSAKDAYEKYLRGETLPSEFYPRICPTRDEMIKIYKLINQKEIDIDTLFVKLYSQGINYCKIMATIEILNELKLISYNVFYGTVSIMQVKNKVDIEKSTFLRSLRSKL